MFQLYLNVTCNRIVWPISIWIEAPRRKWSFGWFCPNTSIWIDGDGVYQRCWNKIAIFPTENVNGKKRVIVIQSELFNYENTLIIEFVVSTHIERCQRFGIESLTVHQNHFYSRPIACPPNSRSNLWIKLFGFLHNFSIHSIYPSESSVWFHEWFFRVEISIG